MFRDAASLCSVSYGYTWNLGQHLPAIVVVAVDVEDLLALNTENTASLLAHVSPRVHV